MTGPVLAALVALLAAAGPAAAHHVGAWSPRDNEVSANFKQIKFSLQAGKPEVARRLYATGALRRELRARQAALPPGLDEAIRAALEAGDAAEAERGLMVFFAALVRDLAREADRQLAAPDEAPDARLATARRFLEAIWRYYNLVDFAVTQRDARAAAGVRLAVDEAESLLRGPAPAGPGPGRSSEPPPAPGPERLRAPFQQIARIMTGVIEATPPRRSS